MKTHSHGLSGEKLLIKTYNQFYYIPHLPLWFSIFIHDCLECQINKHFPLKHNISPPLPFMKVLLISIIVSQWIQCLPLQMVTPTFSSLLMHSVISLLQIPLQTLIPNTQLIPFSTTRLQNSALLNT